MASTYYQHDLGPRIASTGESIGAGFQQGMDEENRRRQELADKRADDERKAMQDQLRQMQYGEMIAKQQEGLMIPADSGINPLDMAVNDASRRLVDQASNLTNMLKNGDIDISEYGSALATIRQQVPALKTFKDTLSNNVAEYKRLRDSGDLSNAMTLQNDDFYGTLLEGGGDISLGVDENGIVTFSGVTKGGEPVSIPASGIGQMPVPFGRAADPYEALEEPFKAIAQTQDTWTPDMDQKAEEILTQQLAAAGDPKSSNRQLLSLAVDRFGIPLNEAKQLLDSYGEEGNPLFDRVKEQWVDKAKTAFDVVAQEQAAKRAALEAKQVQTQATQQRMDVLSSQEARAQQQWDTAQEQAELTKEYNQQRSNAVTNRILNMDPANPQQMANELTAMGAPVVYDPKSGQFVTMRNGKPDQRLGNNPNIIKQWAARQLSRPLDEPAPVKRISPFKRLQNWFDGLGKSNSPIDASRGARKAAQNEKTKAAHAQATKEHWDDMRDDTTTLGDVGLSAVKMIPGAALLGTAGSVISDAAGTAQGKGVAKLRNKAITGAAKLAGAGAKEAAKAAGVVGLALGAKDLGEKINKYTYQQMSPEEQQKRRTITASQRRGRS